MSADRILMTVWDNRQERPSVVGATSAMGTTLVGGHSMGQSTCSVTGCERETHYRQSFCKRHYYWSREHGGATPTMPVWPSAMERALAKSRREGDCLIFTGATSRGYGYIQGDHGKVVVVHRMAWEWANGPVPEGMEVDHVLARGCMSRACFNVAHLEPVTKAENLRRRVGWSKHGIGRYKGDA